MALEVRTIKDDITFIDSGVRIDSSQIRPKETVIADVDSTQPLTILGDNADQVVPLNLGRFREPIQHAQDKPELLYYLVPIVVLVVAGAALAFLTLDDTASIHGAVLPAIGLWAGYTVAATLGTFFVGLGLVDGAILITPSLGQTVVFALAYSLLCGLVGSYLIGLWRDRDIQIGVLIDR